MPQSLDHIEKTLADNYRKEIDQEENIWRTLPFFVAAISLEVAELTQLKDQLVNLPRVSYLAVVILGSIAFGSAFLAVIFLERSIRLGKFKYLAAEPGLLDYALKLGELEKAKALSEEDSLDELKKQLSRQYAATTVNNRKINQSRAFMRSIAGTMTMCSLLASLALGAVTVATQLLRVESGGSDEITRSVGADRTDKSERGGGASISPETTGPAAPPSGGKGADDTAGKHSEP